MRRAGSLEPPFVCFFNAGCYREFAALRYSSLCIFSIDAVHIGCRCSPSPATHLGLDDRNARHAGVVAFRIGGGDVIDVRALDWRQHRPALGVAGAEGTAGKSAVPGRRSVAACGRSMVEGSAGAGRCGSVGSAAGPTQPRIGQHIQTSGQPYVMPGANRSDAIPLGRLADSLRWRHPPEGYAGAVVGLRQYPESPIRGPSCVHAATVQSPSSVPYPVAIRTSNGR